MAPSQWRRALTAGFHFFLALGILIANITNYATAHIAWGWRLSLGLAGAPVGHRHLHRCALPLHFSNHAQQPRHAPCARARRRRGRRAQRHRAGRGRGAPERGRRVPPDGHAVLGVAVPMFFQLTGVIVLAFFAPLVFRTVGFGSNAALMGAVNLGSLLLSTLVIDRSRSPGSWAHKVGEAAIARPYAVAVLVFTCLDSAGFGWSWGPLGALGGAERDFSRESSFYAAWVAVMTVFIALFLPETKGVPLESMSTVWARLWYWKTFVQAENTC
ncbi:hypothetical protein PR202_gb15452 [Eleusine coracana subsp. coracana]|uniref:Uncharacterized protein n=1 Tax=Eleusine coracana subsp. coracana TaxID=191504 RepID=A0AAV5EYA1_ELECO|nr:hypothetical protein PR202_gb15452 [Eleusine coracana subsp. coracana]